MRTTVALRIERAGIRELKIALPKGTGQPVDFRGPLIKERQPPEEGADPEVWTLVFQRRIRGLYRLEVRFDKTVYNDLPYKFEAGTPNIAGMIGLGAAVRYLQVIGMDNVASHEQRLLDYMTSQLAAVDGIRLIGTADSKASVQSFLLDDIHPHVLGTILDHQGVAIRTGHHCAMPVMEYFGIPGTARASLGLYNNEDDIDRLVAGLLTARELFA